MIQRPCPTRGAHGTRLLRVRVAIDVLGHIAHLLVLECDHLAVGLFYRGGWVVGIEVPVQRKLIPQAEQGVGEGGRHGGRSLGPLWGRVNGSGARL